MCWVVCSSGFWCLECLGFEVLRAKVFLMEVEGLEFSGLWLFRVCFLVFKLFGV